MANSRPSADDIARARGRVFDDDQAFAYIGVGVRLTQLQCGLSGLVACPEPALRKGSAVPCENFPGLGDDTEAK